MKITEKNFQLRLQFKNSDTNDPIVFKVDGGRFQSDRTFKFESFIKYKLIVTADPPTKLDSFHIGGSDLPLLSLNGASEEYQTEWYTNNIDPTKRATRQEIWITLQGPCGTLTKALQSKFYNKNDSHADWGQKLESLIWSCALDEQGNIKLVKETFE